jgi:hypothetical protein
MKTFTKPAVKRYMRGVCDRHRDDCGEINMTALAEDAASEFDQKEPGGPLDQETHWIWEAAYEVAEAARQ